MKRFKFPFAYKPKVNLKNTVVYSLILKQQILNFLTNRYKCINVDPTLVADIKNSVLSYFAGDRPISFDNKSNNLILTINSTQDNYLSLLRNKIKNENFICFAPNFVRDSKQTNLDSILNWTINVELSMALSLKTQYFTDVLKQVYYDIVNLANLPELKKIYHGSCSKINPKSIAIIDAQKLESLYPTLSLKEGFNHYCNQHKFVIVQNNLKQLKSGSSLSSLIPTAQDKYLSCGLYAYDEINDQPIHLLNICKRPDGEVAKQQVLDINPDELSNGLYDPKLFESEKQTNISITINFSNLLLFFLDKVHLAEVVKSVWPSDFLDFVKKEHIEIF